MLSETIESLGIESVVCNGQLEGENSLICK